MARSANMVRTFGVAAALLLAAGCAQQEAMAPAPAPAMKMMADCVQRQVHFATGGILMEPGDITTVNAVTGDAAAADARIMLIGKTDRVGSEAANKTLSKRRAELVRKALIDNGVLASKIDVDYTGEEKPEVPTANQQAELLNRTAVLIVVKDCRIP